MCIWLIEQFCPTNLEHFYFSKATWRVFCPDSELQSWSTWTVGMIWIRIQTADIYVNQLNSFQLPLCWPCWTKTHGPLVMCRVFSLLLLHKQGCQVQGFNFGIWLVLKFCRRLKFCLVGRTRTSRVSLAVRRAPSAEGATKTAWSWTQEIL